MKKFLIPVSWTMYGEFVVEAESLEQAIEVVNENVDDKFCIADADGEYADDSFIVDVNLAEEITEYE